jgi:hypothetical protein
MVRIKFAAQLLGCLLFTVNGVCEQPTAPNLQFIPLEKVNNIANHVSFKVIEGRAFPASNLNLTFSSPYFSNDGYRLQIDPKSYSHTGDYWTFNVYLTKPPSRDIFIYQLSEQASSSEFVDARENVEFEIGDNGKSRGTIPVIIHADKVPYDSIVKFSDDKSIYQVWLNHSHDIEVPLNPRLSNVGGKIDGFVVSSENCGDCWDFSDPDLVKKIHDLAVEVSADSNISKNSTIKIPIKPNVLPSLLRSAWLAADVPHDNLKVTFNFIPDGTTWPSDQKVEIPVTFLPPAIPFSVALVSGLALGLFCKRIIAGNTKLGSVLQIIVITLVAEGAAIVLFKYCHTSVKIFGVGLSPLQLIPAFLICFLLSGGYEVFGKVPEWWRKRNKGPVGD